MSLPSPPRHHPLSLRFKDLDLEARFRVSFAEVTASSNRVGIYLATIAWITAGVVVLLGYPGDPWPIVRPLFALVPLFAVVIVASHLRPKSGPPGALAGLANLGALAVIILTAGARMQEPLLFVTGIAINLFFSTFILRIIFRLSVFITLLNLTIAIISVTRLSCFRDANLYFIYWALFLPWFACISGAYLLERADRRIFYYRFQLEKLNEKLRYESFIDPLTKVYNRHYFFEALTGQIESARRYNQSLYLVMIDIDFFKRVNDELGHPTGDTVLKEFADLLKGSFRQSDVVARYGGEEFILMLKNVSREHLERTLKRLLERVEAHKFTWVPWTITCSAGAAQLGPEGDAMSLVQEADDRLYESKRGGRNQITF